LIISLSKNCVNFNNGKDLLIGQPPYQSAAAMGITLESGNTGL